MRESTHTQASPLRLATSTSQKRDLYVFKKLATVAAAAALTLSLAACDGDYTMDTASSSMSAAAQAAQDAAAQLDTQQLADQAQAGMDSAQQAREGLAGVQDALGSLGSGSATEPEAQHVGQPNDPGSCDFSRGYERSGPAVLLDHAQARAALDTLPVKGRAPKTCYDRDLFGKAWDDDTPGIELGRNGCDTRNDILNRDLTDVVHRDGTRGCIVESGVLNGPFTGERIEFTRGTQTSREVQIDHVVALSDAWQKGAQQLTPTARQQLGNDPVNLLAVQGRANQQKGDSDAATWLPSNKAYRCDYVARQISVKQAYSLWVTQAEHDAMAGILAAC